MQVGLAIHEHKDIYWQSGNPFENVNIFIELKCC